MDDVMLRLARIMGAQRYVTVEPWVVDHVFSRAEELERKNAQGRSEAGKGKWDEFSTTAPPISQLEAPGPPSPSVGEEGDEGPRPFAAPNEAKAWLSEHLTAPATAHAITAAARRAGHTKRDIERAKWELRVKSAKIGKRWYWMPAN